MKDIKNKIILGTTILLLSLFFVNPTFADDIPVTDSFSLSPMHQKVILVPGERYTGSVTVSNPDKSTQDIHYVASIAPYTPVGDDYDADFSTNSTYTELVKWVTFDKPEGDIKPGTISKVVFHIDVPKDAPAGGQYAAIMVKNDPTNEAPTEGIMIESTVQMASILYATVMGDTEESGDIITNSFSSFVLNPPVKGAITMKNTGNVHLTSTTSLQIFPLFSNEEIYTNEQKPTENLIMPGTTRSTVTNWKDAPNIGIFHVIQTVKFAGKTSITDKYLFICPIWVLVIIAFMVVFLIIWLIVGHKPSINPENNSQH